MQLLASALPGFRDIRAPLVAGYLWLVLVWIVLKPDIAAAPTNEVMRTVYDLATIVGPIWVGLAVSVAAYLIGSISHAISPAVLLITESLRASTVVIIELLLSMISRPMTAVARLRRNGIRAAFSWKGFQALWVTDDPASRFGNKVANFLTWNTSAEPIGYENRLIEKEMQRAELVLSDLREKVPIRDYRQYVKRVYTRRQVAVAGLKAEMSLPATVLVGKEPELFTEVDRLKAESQFRLAIVPPLVGLVAYISSATSELYLLALVAVAVIASQAVTKNREFMLLMEAALQRGIIKSQSVSEFATWVKKLETNPESTLDVLID